MHRYPFSLYFILFLTFSLIFASEYQEKPNILVVVVDDLGWNDISYNNPLFSTPHIERMAHEGVILNSFYASPSCTPSRAAFMTGRYNIHTGLQDSVIHSTEPRGVPLYEEFISSKLQKVGYTTHAVGKWHLGMHTDAYLPLNRGFDYHYGIFTGGGSHTQHFSVSQSFSPRGSENGITFSGYNLYDEGQVSDDNFGNAHSTFLYNNRAIKYLTNAAKDTNPFFIYLAYQAVHDPIEVGNQKLITETSCNEINEDENESDYESIDWDNRKILCGMVAEIDAGLGNIRSNLEEIGEWDNTLIFFFSDNGGNPSHGSSNYPLTGSKGQYWEGGVKVPAFVAGGFMSKKLKESSIKPYAYKSLVHITDFHKTILGIAGYDSGNNQLDGVDLWDAIVSKKESVRKELLVNINSEMFGGSGAIIVGDYKLMVNGDPKESLIYSKVRKNLASYSGNVWTKSNLDSILETVRNSVFPEKDYFLFNIKKNPTETTHGVCDDVEECANLYSNSEFASIRTELEAKWDEYLSTMVQSSFSWQDDGVLANPEWFSGVWTPWRELDGTPKAQYLGYAEVVAESGIMDSILSWMGIDKSCSSIFAVKSTEQFQFVAPSFGTVSTLVLYLGMVMIAAGIVGYKIGSRKNYNHLP